MRSRLFRSGFGATVCIAVWACDEPAATPVVDTDPAMPTAARQRILDFWQVYQRATKLRVTGDVAAALARYDSALALNPSHGDALYHSGGAAFHLRDYSTAESHWRRLLAVDGSNARAHVQLGAMYSCGLPGAPVDLAQAREELVRALAINPVATGPQVRLGEIALLQGDTQAATASLEAVRQTNERSVTAHYLGGYLHWQAGRLEAAADALGQATGAAGGGRAEASASAEGQTRRGFRPLLETGDDGLLAPHWQGRLADFGPVTQATTQTEYDRFHRATDALRQRFATVESTSGESTRNEDR